MSSLIERYLPSAPLSWLVGAGASAVAAELTQETAGHDAADGLEDSAGLSGEQ